MITKIINKKFIESILAKDIKAALSLPENVDIDGYGNPGPGDPGSKMRFGIDDTLHNNTAIDYFNIKFKQ